MPVVVRRASVVAGVVIVFALVGCAPSGEVEPWAFGEAPAGDSAESPVESDAVDVSALAAGDTIPEELARDHNRDLKDGLRGYELPDGTFVLVAQDEPLPAAVKADAEAKAAAVPVITGTSRDEQTASIDNGLNLASALSFATGKRIVAVVYGTVVFSDFTVKPAWRAAQAPLNADGLYPIGTDLNAVIAETEALIAQQSNPAEWEIIVQPR